MRAVENRLVDVVEGSSACHYDAAPCFFLVETLPMPTRLRVLLPIDFDDLEDPEGIAQDASRRKYLKNVRHRECDVYIDIWEADKVPAVMSLVRQAREHVLSEDE